MVRSDKDSLILVILICDLLAESAEQIVRNKTLPTLTTKEQNNILGPVCLRPAPDTNTSQRAAIPGVTPCDARISTLLHSHSPMPGLLNTAGIAAVD